MKYKVLHLLLLLAVSIGYCQIGFQQNVVIDDSFGVVNPSSIVTADVDGDGLEDVIVSGSREVAWFKNLDNNGNFSKTNTIFSDFDNQRNLQVADLDNDNDIDIFFNIDTNQGKALVWLENTDGLGNFADIQTLVINDWTSPIGYQIIDVDADGDLDIAFGYRGFIGWVENDNLTFTVNVLLGSQNTAANNYQGLTVTDVNGDNLKDFVVDVGYDLRVYDFQSDGSLGFLGTIGTFAQGDFVTSADLDNDGDNDIIRIFENGGNDRKIRFYENLDGLGNFANVQTLVTLVNLPLTSNSDTKSLKLKDIDGDNFLDIILHESRTKRLSTYLNLGSNTFGVEVVVADNFVNLNSIYVSDVNGDQQQDILTTSRDDHQVSWFQNLDGLGNYTNENKITTYAYFINHVDAGDLDGDGDIDIVSSSHADNKLAWYANVNGFGNFSQPQQIISNDIPAPRNAFIVDINNDSFNDVLFFSYLDDNPDEYKIMWLQNDSNGNFIQEHVVDNIEEQIVQIQYVDIDNDGDFDIVSAEDDSVLKLYKNNGDGTFANSVVFSEPGFYYPLSLKVGDVDNDNDMDVLASYNNNEIVWYENLDGQGDLTSKNVIIPQMEYPSSIFLVDINQDSFKDLIFANKFSDEIGYFLNTDGLGNFGEKQIIPSSVDNPSAIYALDVDADGDQDIIANSESNSKLVWFQNDGTANFSESIEITVMAERINHITSADFNADGKPDLLTSSYDDDQIAWYGNLGTFTNTISGVVKLDANADGCDENDAGIPNLLIITENGENTFATFTDENGAYSFSANQEVFTTSIESALPNYFGSIPLVHTNDFTDSSFINADADFCVEANQTINDLSVVIYPDLDDPRPGFDTSYKIIYANTGTTPQSGDLTFEFDSTKIQFLDASGTLANQTSNSLTFNFSDLIPFETRIIDLNFNVFPPPTTNIDEILVSTASISPVTGDETEQDNTYELQQTVIGSYDPNDIQILEGDEVHIDDAGEYLHFLIRFQNTGTASAINVRVEHVLDDKLDWQSIQLQGLSHEGRVEITNGNSFQFIFNDIYLPDSTSDEPNSHGYIAFRIKPKEDVIIGDVISGVADIYFDFNPPIITNVATTEFVETLGNSSFTANRITLFPNPTFNALNLISNVEIQHIEIYNTFGKLVLNEKFSSVQNAAQIDVDNLDAGLYFIVVYANETKQVKKFIKQ